MTISLGRDLRPFSSDQPGGQRATSFLPIWSCSKRGLPGSLVAQWPVGSYPTFSPLLSKESGMFLWHSPEARACWTLSSALPCGARTFLIPLGDAVIWDARIPCYDFNL